MTKHQDELMRSEKGVSKKLDLLHGPVAGSYTAKFSSSAIDQPIVRIGTSFENACGSILDAIRKDADGMSQGVVLGMNRTVQDLVRRLRDLQRYEHSSCDDGDGHIDDWASRDEYGEYVLWSDVKKLADEFDLTKHVKARTTTTDRIRCDYCGHYTDEQ